MFVCHFHHVHPEKCPVRLIPQIIHACPYITTTQLLKHSIDVAKRQTAWIVSVHAVAIFYTLNLEIADSCPFSRHKDHKGIPKIAIERMRKNVTNHGVLGYQVLL